MVTVHLLSGDDQLRRGFFFCGGGVFLSRQYFFFLPFRCVPDSSRRIEKTPFPPAPPFDSFMSEAVPLCAHASFSALDNVVPRWWRYQEVMRASFLPLVL